MDETLTTAGASAISQDHEFLAVDGRTYTVLGPLSDGWRPVLAPHGLYGLGVVRRARGRVEVRRQGGRVTSYSGRGFSWRPRSPRCARRWPTSTRAPLRRGSGTRTDRTGAVVSRPLGG